MGRQEKRHLAFADSGGKASRVRSCDDQEVARSVPVSLLSNQPIQAHRHSEWSQGRLGWIALTSRRLARSERFRSHRLAHRAARKCSRLMLADRGFSRPAAALQWRSVLKSYATS